MSNMEGWVYNCSRLLADVVHKLLLHGVLCCVPLFAKAGIGGVRLQVSKLIQILDPLVADARADQLRQARIREREPPPRRHAVGLVAEALRIHLVEIAQYISLQ